MRQNRLKGAEPLLRITIFHIRSRRMPLATPLLKTTGGARCVRVIVLRACDV